jgi:putative FmdB family regulatory protein
MPTYTYRCDKCGEKVERLIPISQHTSTIECDGCGGVMTQYIKYLPGIDTHFDGSFKRENPCRGAIHDKF